MPSSALSRTSSSSASSSSSPPSPTTWSPRTRHIILLALALLTFTSLMWASDTTSLLTRVSQSHLLVHSDMNVIASNHRHHPSSSSSSSSSLSSSSSSLNNQHSSTYADGAYNADGVQIGRKAAWLRALTSTQKQMSSSASSSSPSPPTDPSSSELSPEPQLSLPACSGITTHDCHSACCVRKAIRVGSGVARLVARLEANEAAGVAAAAAATAAAAAAALTPTTTTTTSKTTTATSTTQPPPQASPPQLKIAVIGNSVSHCCESSNWVRTYPTTRIFTEALQQRYTHTRMHFHYELVHGGFELSHLFYCGREALSDVDVVIVQYEHFNSIFHETRGLLGEAMLQHLLTLPRQPTVVLMQHCTMPELEVVVSDDVDAHAAAYVAAHATNGTGTGSVQDGDNNGSSNNGGGFVETPVDKQRKLRARAADFARARRFELELADKYDVTIVSACAALTTLLRDECVDSGGNERDGGDRGRDSNRNDTLAGSAHTQTHAHELPLRRSTETMQRDFFATDTDRVHFGRRGTHMLGCLAAEAVVGVGPTLLSPPSQPSSSSLRTASLPYVTPRVARLLHGDANDTTAGTTSLMTDTDAVKDAGDDSSDDVVVASHHRHVPHTSTTVPRQPFCLTTDTGSLRTHIVNATVVDDDHSHTHIVHSHGWSFTRGERDEHKQWYAAHVAGAVLVVRTPPATSLLLEYYQHHSRPMGAVRVVIDPPGWSVVGTDANANAGTVSATVAPTDTRNGTVVDVSLSQQQHTNHTSTSMVVDGCCPQPCIPWARGQGFYRQTPLASSLPYGTHIVVITLLHKTESVCTVVGDEFSLVSVLGAV